MNIVLIYLPQPYLKQPEAQFSIGLLYLASILKQNKINVQIKNYSSMSFEEAIFDLPEANIYGITSTSFEINMANRFSFMIKNKYPQSIVGIGGPGTCAEEFIDYKVVDFICQGEGENTILEICNDYKNKNIKKKYVGIPVHNLDSIPFPSRNMITKQGGNIFAYNKKYKTGESTIVLTSRGCPFKCAFCASPFFTKLGQTVRYRSAQNVYEEIKEIIDYYNIREIRISDDMFTSNRERAFQICSLLSKLNIAWRISTRVKPFDKELAKLLYNSGCREISFGIESFDDNVLFLLNKKTTVKDNVEALNICEKIGINTRILLMIRTPGQTLSTIKKNIQWLKRVPYTIVSCTNFVPIPGSDIWYNPDKYNIIILDRNMDHYNFYSFGRKGENELFDIIKIKNRTLKEFNEESIMFKEYLKSTGKLNLG